MDVFFQERELCELFKSKNKNFKIEFSIRSEWVVIRVFHVGEWDIGKRNIFLKSTLNNFKLSLLGWSNSCKVLNCNSYINNESIAEYTYKMKGRFEIEKFFDYDFLEYDNKYDF